MSFKHWLENMSTFEMISVLIGLSLTLAFIIAIFFSFRGGASQFKDARVFLEREKWEGELYQSTINSWHQTNIRHGIDFFYDIFFYIDGESKLRSAKALISPGQMHLLVKGLPIVVKIGKGNRMAVVRIGK